MKWQGHWWAKKGIRNNTCGHNVKISPKDIVVDVYYVTIEKTFKFAEIPHLVAQLVAGNLTFQKFVKT